MDLALHPDKWLSINLKKPAYKLTVHPETSITAPDLGRRIRKALNTEACFVYCKVPTTEVTVIHALEAASFHLVDTSLTMKKPLDDNASQTPSTRFAHVNDLTAVGRIAEQNFSYSRFHMDPLIPTAQANTIKKNWAINFFSGKRGDSMVVAEQEGEVAGFLQLIRVGPDLIIDLLAVDDQLRRQGLASNMISFAQSHNKELQHIITGTQAANIAAIRFYEDMGFRVISSNHVFHLHQ